MLASALLTVIPQVKVPALEGASTETVACDTPAMVVPEDGCTWHQLYCVVAVQSSAPVPPLAVMVMSWPGGVGPPETAENGNEFGVTEKLAKANALWALSPMKPMTNSAAAVPRTLYMGVEFLLVI